MAIIFELLFVFFAQISHKFRAQLIYLGSTSQDSIIKQHGYIQTTGYLLEVRLKPHFYAENYVDNYEPIFNHNLWLVHSHVTHQKTALNSDLYKTFHC